MWSANCWRGGPVSELDRIGVAVVDGTEDGRSGHVAALLREIESLLRSLVERDEGGSIDLRSLPLTENDLVQLEEALGEGEVAAQVDSLGFSRVWETAVSGVWWVSHENEEGEVIGEFIEVTYCPEILITPTEDVKESWQALRARLLESEYGKTMGDAHGGD
jgi:hydrogenase-1 operon protein HyaF